MAGVLYLFVITVLLLFALAVSIPVLVNIVREGLERRREWKSGERERYTEDEEFGPEPPITETDENGTSPDGQVCRHCATVNDATYSFCKECSEPL